ncbi:MAG: hypothetical protein K2K06_02515 [Oscillospiraceae bacterium]|nr:hypothetical protein [Oscillospiraceae bacterium]
MQLFLYRDTKDGTIHASANQKATGCRTKLKNASQLSPAGTEDFSDLMVFLDKVNCQNCQNYFTPRILKSDRKAMKQKLKAEKKGIINYESTPDTSSTGQERPRIQPVSPPPAPAPVQPVAPVAPPEPEPTPTVPDVPDLDDSFLPQYEEWVPPSKKQKSPASANPMGMDDELSKFMLGKQEDPTAAAFASDNSKNPNVLAEQQEADKTASDAMNDMLAQFAIPNANVPEENFTSAQDSNAVDVDDAFALNHTDTPNFVENSTPAQDSNAIDVDDMLAQFALNHTDTPSSVESSTPAQDSNAIDVDDMLAQFALNDTDILNSVENSAPAQDFNAIDVDDTLAKFAIPESEESISKPTQETASKPITSMEEILAEFGQKRSEKEEKTLQELLEKFNEEKQKEEQNIQPAPTEPETPAIADFDNLEVPQLNASSLNNTQVIKESVLQPVADELDSFEMAPKEENKEDDEFEYMSRVVNTRLEDYDDDDDDDDDYDDDDYFDDDDDDEEYHGSSYAPSDDDDDEDTEDYVPQETVKTSKKENQLTVEDIRAATAAMNAAAGNLQAATAAMNAAAAAKVPVPEFSLPNLENLGISNVPELDIPNVPELNIPNVPALDIPSVPTLDIPNIPNVPDIPSNPFEADANADIPEVPTLAEVPTIADDNINAFSAPPIDSMGYQPMYQQQPVYPQQPIYNQPVYSQPQYAPQQQPVYPQPAPAPAVHTTAPYGTPAPQQPVSQGVRVSTIGQNTVIPDSVRNAIAKTATQTGTNIFDQQGKKVEVLTDITSALSQMGADTSSFNKPQKEEEEPVIQGYKEWRPRERDDKKLADFKKGLHKKNL